jgi:GTPase SAR1 family protein
MNWKKRNMGKKTFELVLVGDVRSGKSALLSRISKKNFSSEYVNTRICGSRKIQALGEAEFLVCELGVIEGMFDDNEEDIQLLKDMNGCCILVDLTQDAQQIDTQIKSWMRKITAKYTPNTPIFVIGTKADLAEVNTLARNKDAIREAVVSNRAIHAGYITSAKERNTPEFNVQLGDSFDEDIQFTSEDGEMLENILQVVLNQLNEEEQEIQTDSNSEHQSSVKQAILDKLSKLKARSSIARKNDEKKSAINDLIIAVSDKKLTTFSMLLKSIEAWQICTINNQQEAYVNNKMHLDIMGEHRHLFFKERPGILTESQRVIRSIKETLLTAIQDTLLQQSNGYNEESKSDAGVVTTAQDSIVMTNIEKRIVLDNLLEDSMTQVSQRIQTLRSRRMNKDNNDARADRLESLLAAIRLQYIELTKIVDFTTNKTASMEAICKKVTFAIDDCLDSDDGRLTMASYHDGCRDSEASNPSQFFSPEKKTTTKSMLSNLSVDFNKFIPEDKSPCAEWF